MTDTIKILISPDYGAGWSTEHREYAIVTHRDPDIIKAVEAGLNRTNPEEFKKVVQSKVPLDSDFGFSGSFNLVIKEVPKGSFYYIGSYDGAEYLITEKNMYKAEEPAPKK